MDVLKICAIMLSVSLITTLLLVKPVEMLARKIGAIDYPGGRHIHSHPVPRIGGVAIMGGMVAATIVFIIGVWLGYWDTVFRTHPTLNISYPIAILGVFCMFMTGFADDIFDLSPKIKIILQTLSTIIIATSGILITGVHAPWGYIDFGVFALPITILYIIAFANIINLIDGLDGLAGGISVIVLLTLLWFAAITSRFDATVIAMMSIGAISGFLYFNIHPARIFMGDCGSLLIGTMIAIVSICAISRTPAIITMAVPIVSAAVPIIDAFSAIIRRKRSHLSILSADAHHIHHQLLSAGFSYNTCVLMMWGWTLMMSIGSMVALSVTGWLRAIIFFVIITISIIAIYKLKLTVPATIHAYKKCDRNSDIVAGMKDIEHKK